MVSIRRFEKEGRLTYMKMGIKLNLYRTFRGEIRSQGVVTYEFDAWKKPSEPDEFLDKIEAQLLKLEEHSRHYSRRAKNQTTKKNLRQLTPRLNEYSDLMEDLEIYLNKEERHTLRKLKWRNLFQRRRGSGPQSQ
jgi:hypothetical protein